MLSNGPMGHGSEDESYPPFPSVQFEKIQQVAGPVLSDVQQQVLWEDLRLGPQQPGYLPSG